MASVSRPPEPDPQPEHASPRRSLRDIAGEGAFASELSWAQTLGYEVSYHDEGGFWITNPITDSVIMISNSSFVGNPGQGARIVRDMLDEDKARGVMPWRVITGRREAEEDPLDGPSVSHRTAWYNTRFEWRVDGRHVSEQPG
jgi:hypothetical protein